MRIKNKDSPWHIVKQQDNGLQGGAPALWDKPYQGIQELDTESQTGLLYSLNLFEAI